jgi:hypothetical protein
VAYLWWVLTADVHAAGACSQSRCANAARAAEAAAAEREQLERKVARLEKAKETEHKGMLSINQPSPCLRHSAQCALQIYETCESSCSPCVSEEAVGHSV